MKFTNKTKNIFKSVLCIVIAAATVFGAAALFSNRKSELKEIHPAFSIGGLTEAGKYVEQNNTIYTKEAFDCEGLRIDVDFEKNIMYNVFFYAENGEFISSTGNLTENFVNNVPEGAELARVLISPDWEALEVEKDDRVISWFDIAKYSNQITIKVAAESKKTDEDTTLSEDDITDLAGTVWIIDSVVSEPGKKRINNSDKSNIGEASSFSSSGSSCFSMNFAYIGLGYDSVLYDEKKDSVGLRDTDLGELYLKPGYIIRFYDTDAATDADLIEFMRENATLLYIHTK